MSMELHGTEPKPSISLADEAPIYKEARNRTNEARRRQTAYRARLREEQAEARALGVAVVEKVALDNRWTEEEWDVLRALYPDYARMRSKLPGRTLWAIRTQCRQIGLHQRREGHALWTTPATKRLREIYATASTATLRAEFPTMTSYQIKARAAYLKLKRPRRALSSSGNELCDAIRSRARELNLTMRDLDLMASTGRYFALRSWKRNGHSYSKMVRSIHALGGTVTVDWGKED